MKIVLKFLIIALLPIVGLAQALDSQITDYRTGVAINFGIGNSTIEIESNTFNGNSSIVSVQGDFTFSNGLTITPDVGVVKTDYQANLNSIFSSNELSAFRSSLKLGYGFNFSNQPQSKIRFLPRIGLYYSNYTNLTSTGTDGTILFDDDLGGNFGFITDLGISIELSKVLYTEIAFSRSSDFNSVTFSNQDLKIKDDKTIRLSFGFLF